MDETLFPPRQGTAARWIVRRVAANPRSMRFAVRRTVIVRTATGKAKRLHDLGVPDRYARSRAIAAMVADALNAAERRQESEPPNKNEPGAP